MHLDPTAHTVAAWRALLTLHGSERAAFLSAAQSFHAASINCGGADALPFPASRPALAQPSATPASRHAERCGGIAAKPATLPSRSKRLSGRPARPGEAQATAAGHAVLPLLGGSDLDLSLRSAFEQPAFRNAWRPGRRVHVYVASTPGLGRLVRPLQVPAYRLGADVVDLMPAKAGTAQDIGRRLAELNRSGYGSVSRADRTIVEPGFTSWTAEAFPVGAVARSPGSPVRTVGNGIEITLPEEMTPEGFDQALSRRLAGASLAGWAQSDAGLAICAEHGMNPERLVRGTPGPKARSSWATEILLIRPRHDAVRLVRVVEDIVIEIVLAGARTPSRQKRRAD